MVNSPESLVVLKSLNQQGLKLKGEIRDRVAFRSAVLKANGFQPLSPATVRYRMKQIGKIKYYLRCAAAKAFNDSRVHSVITLLF